MKMSQYDLVIRKIQQNSLISTTAGLVTSESGQKKIVAKRLLKVNKVL
jgi:hypothetical protein